MRHWVYIVFLFTLLSGCLPEEKKPTVPPEAKATLPPVVVKTQVDKAQMSTDEKLKFSITVDADENVVVDLPEAGSSIEGFRITDFGVEEPVVEQGRKLLERWYLLEADISGTYVLPAIQLSYTKADGELETTQTSEIFVEVGASGAAAGEKAEGMQDILDIKPLEAIAFRLPLWALILLGVLLAGGAGYGIWYYLKIRRLPKPIPDIPAHETALADLESLVVNAEIDEKAYHFTLSEILRVYLEKRYGMAATDMTYEELCQNIVKISEVQKENRSQFLTVMERTDRVKFTDFIPEKELVEQTHSLAKDFVLATKPKEEIPAEEEAVI